MSDTYILGAITLCMAGLFFTIWNIYGTASQDRVDIRNRNASLMAIVCWVGSKSLNFNARADVNDLIESGLSGQNYLQIGVVAAVSIWAFFLLFSQRIRLSNLFVGSRGWITAFITLFSLSTLWSVWPEATIFRSVELIAMWIVVVHYFASSKEALRDIGKVIFLSMLCLFAGSALFQFTVSGHLLNSPNIFGAFRSNTGGMFSCIFLLLLMHRKLQGQSTPKIIWASTFILAICFGSMTSFSILILLTLVYAVLRANGVTRLFGLTFLLPTAGLFAWLAQDSAVLENNSILEPVAMLFGKHADQLFTITGRIPLWTAVIEETLESPWGQGGGAAERLLAGTLRFHEVGWTAYNAHNGYLSAWLGTGWPGLVIVVFVFLAVATQIRRINSSERILISTIIWFIALNNFTISGVGGVMSPVWLLLMSVAVIPLDADPSPKELGPLGISDKNAKEISLRLH